MGLIEHAKNELTLAGYFDKDGMYNGMIGDAVMELIEKFSEQGHSGMSASIVRQLFNRVADYGIIKPISFEDDNWIECAEQLYQHKRKSTVFKICKGGRPYYLDAFVKVAKFPDGHTSNWSGVLIVEGNKKVSYCYIKNPSCMPTIEIELDVKYYGDKSSDWDFLPAKEEQLEELKKYYDFDIISI